MNLRYPNITGKTPMEQIDQLRGYLYNLVEQLNMEGAEKLAVAQKNGGVDYAAAPKTAYEKSESQMSTPQSTFNQVKSLIIKSAEIIDAYYTEINKRLEGVYVASSEYGEYEKKMAQEIKATSERIDQVFADYQSISGQVSKVIATGASIRTGLLFTVGEETLEPELGQTELVDGTNIYGVEVGQTTMVDGKEVFHKFARFTSYGMTMYDDNGNLSAYITDRKLNIPHAEIKNTLTRGGFVETINADGSGVERWVG